MKEGQSILQVLMYEAPFCCTMRYAEGLLAYTQNEQLFGWNDKAKVQVDAYGRKFVEDKLLVKCGDEETFLFAGYTVDEDTLKETHLQIF